MATSTKRKGKATPAIPVETDSFVFPDGGRYIGGYMLAEGSAPMRHSKGVMQFANGATYDGEWQMDQMHGQGTLKYADGLIYEGEFQDGHYHGSGKLYFPNGSTYTGQFLASRPEGQGTIVDPDGTTWLGTVQDLKGAFQPRI
eukprot:m.71018 g.71018  ORF g.71018 m.71018 type:complete len:143 (-) comp13798_c1_seq4:113-541(-)